MTVYGRPGAGLDGSPAWARNADVARVGAAGEARTAKVLASVEASNPAVAVIHDIMVPNSRGHRYNIDHAVVSGRTVLLIDSKAWSPGFLWTAGGVTRRGLERFPAADSRSVAAAHRDIAALLSGTGAVLPTPLVAVWPTNGRSTMQLWCARYHGARLVHGQRLASAVSRVTGPAAPADPVIVARLAATITR